MRSLTRFGAVLVLWVLGGCSDPGTQTEQPQPYAGVWSGTVTYEDYTVYVNAWLEQSGTRVAGVLDATTGWQPEPTPVARDRECDIQAEVNDDGTLDVRWTTESDDEIGLDVTYVPATESLVGSWSTTVGDQVVEVTGELERVSWLATRQDADIPLDGVDMSSPVVPSERGLRCIAKVAPACADGLDNDSDGRVDAADPACWGLDTWWDGSWSGLLIALDDESGDPPCFDLIDNDGDGLVDGDDPECKGSLYNVESGDEPDCWDGWDNDGDGRIDLDDPDCEGDRGGRDEVPDACADGVDNDRDRTVDGADEDCTYANAEIGGLPPCANQYDDDGNGLIDLEDPTCRGDPDHIWEGPFSDCDDHIDNDGDGLVDLEEATCEENLPYFEDGYPTIIVDSDCEDGVDNDGDGYTDMDDPQCVIVGSGVEDGEWNWMIWTLGPCNNSVDDDADGLVDDEDPACAVHPVTGLGGTLPNSLFKFESVPPCLDGLDNDGDLLVDDFDPQCLHPLTASEAVTCADGYDNDGDGFIDGDDPSCGPGSFGRENAGECADGVDNDADGLVDRDDPSCHSAHDPRERPACADGLDNDGDRLYDLADPGCGSAMDDDEVE